MTKDPYEPSRDFKKQYGGERRNGKAPGLPKWHPNEDDDAQAFADYLNEVWPALGNDPIVGGERFGTDGDTPLSLIRRSGERIRWARQASLFKPGGLQEPMTMQAAIAPRKLTGDQAAFIAWAAIRLSSLRADLDAQEELVSWWADYITTRKPKEANPELERDWRVTLAEWQAARTFDELRKPDEPRHTFIVIDARDGVRYIRREDFGRHARYLHSGGLSWRTLNGIVAEAGWQQTRFQMRETAAGAPYVEARCYVVPADWPEPDPGEPQQTLGNAS